MLRSPAQRTRITRVVVSLLPRRYQRLSSIRPGLCAPLSLHYCGKPFPMVFESAQRYLEGYSAVAAEAEAAADTTTTTANNVGAVRDAGRSPFEAIYMVGGA